MLQFDDIERQALQIAQANKLGGEIKRVVVSGDFDHEGRASLRVTFILKSGWTSTSRGKNLTKITQELNSYLSKSGDERFAYTHYMTAREFSASDDLRRPTSGRRRAAG